MPVGALVLGLLFVGQAWATWMYSTQDEGAIVGDGDGASYQLGGGLRHWVPDSGTYWTIYFMNGQRSYTWSQGQVYGIPLGADATAPAYPPQDDGAIVKDPNGASWQLSGSQRHSIADTGAYWTIYFMNGQRAITNYGWDRVNRVPTGSVANPPAYPPQDDGAIITDLKNASWQLLNSERHWIPTTAVYGSIYNSNGHRAYTNYGWDRVNRVPRGSDVGITCPTPAADATNGAVRVWLTTELGAKTECGLIPQSALSFSTAAGGTQQLIVINDDSAHQRQPIEGFGAALTDTSAILLNRLPEPSRSDTLRQLFDQNSGIGLSYLRRTIGVSDFSPDPKHGGPGVDGLYYYGDTSSDFIAHDRADVLPILTQARQLNTQLSIMASPWSPPPSMKLNNAWNGGDLRSDKYDAYANYLIDFLRAYQSAGMPVAAITLQNEPHYAAPYPSMNLSATQEDVLLKCYVGPKLSQQSIATKVLIWDHNWGGASLSDGNSNLVPGGCPVGSLNPQNATGLPYVQALLGDAGIRPFIGGVAFHCYGTNVTDEDQVASSVPTYLTECTGGDWSGARELKNVLYSPITAMRRGARAALLWNLALNDQTPAGPTINGNVCTDSCRGLVTVSGDNHVHKNQDFYALGHLSEFTKPGARRIDSDGPTCSAQSPGCPDLLHVAFMDPDGTRVVVVLNQGTPGTATQLAIQWHGQSFSYSLDGGAAVTFAWKGSTTTQIPGDITGDCLVDLFDYNVMVGNFGKTGQKIPGDINQDGIVDIFDYSILVGNFGKHC